MATLYSIEEIDKFLRDRGMSLEGDEATRRERAKGRRMRESPAYKKAQDKYKASDKGKKTMKAYAEGGHKEVKERYRQKNKAAHAARTANYRALQKQATSPFITPAEKFAINSMFIARDGLSLPRKKYNVDHFVPFKASETKQGKPIASGLHNILNLRLMLEGPNKGKQNLIPKTSLLQVETPPKNLFETLTRVADENDRRSGRMGGAGLQKPYTSMMGSNLIGVKNRKTIGETLADLLM
jgi:hypothetical protein